MHDWKSLSHVRWDCKYHVVIVPKYRKRRLYVRFRESVGGILKELCRQKRIEMLERHLMPGHIHGCLTERATEVQHCIYRRVFER